MSHQPFETWLLDETTLSTKQEAQLKAHLESCPDCRKFQAGWHAARHTLRTARLASPAPGFSQRFSASLAERRARQAHQQQIRYMILGLALGGFGLACLLVFLLFSTYTPVQLLVHASETVAGMVSLWNRAQTFAAAAIQQPFIVVIWILLSSGLCLLVGGWLFTLWRISTNGAQKS